MFISAFQYSIAAYTNVYYFMQLSTEDAWISTFITFDWYRHSIGLHYTDALYKNHG